MKRFQKVARFGILSTTIGMTGLVTVGVAMSCPSPSMMHSSSHSKTHQTMAQQTETQPVSEATVTIEAFQFKPDNITLKKGGKVTFVNKDATPHTVTPTPDAKFTGTGRIEANQMKTVVFDAVGSQNYFCEIHPSMMGTIKVVE